MDEARVAAFTRHAEEGTYWSLFGVYTPFL